MQFKQIIFNKWTMVLPVFFFGFLFAFAPARAAAAWDATNIISDAQFTASSTMTEAEIQEFLGTKGSFLATFVIPTNKLNYYDCDSDGDGYKDDTCSVWANNIGPNNDIDSTGWTTAHLIYMSAQWYGLNPQVIISTLQKEQSLITMTTYSSYAVNWAMGYGVPDGTVRNYRYEGIAKQIDMATWQLAWNMAKANSTDPVQRAKVSPYYTGNTLYICYTYGSTSCLNTYLSNGATASLYRYTPYFHGNQLFYNIISSWFVFQDWQTTLSNTYVSISLALSNDAPAIGERVTVTYTILNSNDYTVRFENVGVAARMGTQNVDMGWYGVLVLAANESKALTFTKTFYEAGSITAWASYNYQASFYPIGSRNGATVSVAFCSHLADIKATSVISLNTSPVANQAATYVVVIKNNEANRVYYSHMGLANRMSGVVNYDIGWDLNGSIGAGETKTLSFSKSLPEGVYYAWTSICIGGNFYEVWDDVNINCVGFSVAAFSKLITVTSSLSLSNNLPSIGEEITANYSLKNNSTLPVTFSYLGVGSRDGLGNNADFLWLRDITVSAGATYTVNVTKINTAISQYNNWISYAIGPYFYNPIFPSFSVSKTYTTHIADVRAITTISASTSSPISGQSVVYQTTVKNNESHRIYFSHLGLAARNIATLANADLGYLANGYLEAGEAKILTFTKTLSTGQYYIWTTIHIGNDFYDIRDGANVNHLYIKVK